ncbi:SNRPD3 [Cordylochernes scorpioides]|uniref:Small nuclear ribonucleoprotein Sm D3 n=1 Tax=Cordylochernes scorpioides TaxID=51811 RepID=A0ABY6JXP7_9ARAC|nr:SNRPD3 [Cordylochernes scorpioides]
MSIGVPIKVLHEAEGHIVTCETNTGEVYRGKLVEAEDNMNCQMSNLSVTLRDGKTIQLENVYIRGSKIRFMILPDMLKNAPMFKRAGGRGGTASGGRGKSAILRAQVPIKILHEAEGHIVTCETNTGEVYRGTLVEAEDNMNCQLKELTVTNRSGKVSNLDNVYIRGSKIRFMILPDMLKNAPMFKKAGPRGVGGGRGKSGILRAQELMISTATGLLLDKTRYGTVEPLCQDNNLQKVYKEMSYYWGAAK